MFKKTAKIFAIILCAFCAGFLHTLNIFAEKSYPEPSKLFYVNDLADVINVETESYIVDSNLALKAQTGGQIVIMTVKDLNGEAIEDYAHSVFEQYGIGSADKNNGTLILLSVGDRQSRIELGRGTEGFITDAESGRIQDNYMIPDFKNNNWNDGLRKGFDAVLARYEKEYEIDVSETAIIEEPQDNEAIERESFLLFGLFAVCFAVAKIFKPNRKVRIALSITGMILSAVSLFYTNVFGPTISVYLLAAGMGMLMGSLFEFHMLLSSGGHYHGGGWSSGGHSSSGHSGGGGHSSGGGSSRSF